MAGTWDQDYNPGSIAEADLARLREAEWQREYDARQIARGYITMDTLSGDEIRSNFTRFIGREDNEWLAHGSANRMHWICHNCGCLGFKQNLRETFRCYGCRSRNVQIFRAGEVSMAIRGVINATSIGINMQDIWAARRNRMRMARLARRTQ